ncbi:MAG: N-acetylmuramoyl-L-alanine amidase [Firmicutes bacterium]|nr:N-acetylmuramoyl-L-alanine amidase [Bacillota bacterium]MCM1402024.1 N-acetylmuramoyl-L-alanine amidase [Bacteroides sp.]MCM1477953.1 N-acetylmuramoyl-L-alanine amidase [Bacteroides sp.]
MRNINQIIIHCTATKAGRKTTVSEIDRWHRARGFRGIGYHYVIHLDGTVERGRNESVAGAHCKGRNANSIGVCYVGGLDSGGKPADTRTPRQRKALVELVATLRARYPGATVHGHCEFAAKACPCFNVKAEFG